MGEVDPGGVEQLMAMGFDEDKATKALQRANNDFEEAVTIILDDDCTVLPAATPPRSRRVSVISDGSSDEDDEHDVSGEAACGVAGAPSHGDDIVGGVVVEDEAEQAKGESTFVALPQPVTLEVQDGPLGLGLRSCSAKDLADAYSAELGYFATVNGMQGAAEAHNERANIVGAQPLVEGMLLIKINDEAVRGLGYDTVQQVFSTVARPLSVTFAPRSLVEHEERNLRLQREAEQQLLEDRRRVLRQLRTQLRSRRLFLEAADLVSAVEIMLQVLGPQSPALSNAQDEGFDSLLCAKECVPPLVSMLAKGELLTGHARSWQDQVDIWDRIGHAGTQVRAWRQLISRIVEVCIVLLREYTATWVLEPLHQMLNGQGTFFSYTPASYVVNGRKIQPPNEGAQELHYHAVNEFKSMGGLDLIAQRLHILPYDAQQGEVGMDAHAPAERSSSEVPADPQPEAGRQLSLSDTKWVLHILYRIHNLNTALEWRRVAGAVKAVADRIETMDPDMLDANREPLPATLTHMLQLKNALLALAEEDNLGAECTGAGQSESDSGEDDMASGDASLATAVDDKRSLSHRAAARLASSLSLRLSAVWPHAALRCFFSPKLNPRRLGAEIFGKIARHIKQGRMEFAVLETDEDDSEVAAAAIAPASSVVAGTSVALNIGQGTSGALFLVWLQRCGVWRRLLADETLDDRVVDEVENAMLLPLLPHTQESVEQLQTLALPKLSRASVQKLLASWVLHRDFPRTMLLHFLQRLSQRLTLFMSGACDGDEHDTDEMSILNFVDKVMAGRTKQLFARSKAVAKAGLQLLLTCLWCPALDAELQEAKDDARLRSVSTIEEMLEARDESTGGIQYDATLCGALRQRLLHAFENALTLPAVVQHRLPLARQFMNAIRAGYLQAPAASQTFDGEEEETRFPLRRLTFKLLELVISSFPAPIKNPMVLQTDFGKDAVPTLDLQGSGLGFITPPASPARVGARTPGSAVSPGKRSRWNSNSPMPSPGTPGTPRDHVGNGARDSALTRAEFIEGDMDFEPASGHQAQFPPVVGADARHEDGLAVPHASSISDWGKNPGLGGSDLIRMLTAELHCFVRRGAAGHGTSTSTKLRTAIGKHELNAAAEVYLSGIRARLQLLSFVHRYSSLTLSNAQLDDLWDLFVEIPCSSDASLEKSASILLRRRVLEVFFSWLRIASCFHSAHECKWICNGQACFGSATVQRQQCQSQQLEALFSQEIEGGGLSERVEQKQVDAADWVSSRLWLRRKAAPPDVDVDPSSPEGTDDIATGQEFDSAPRDSQRPSSSRDDRRLALVGNADLESICGAHEHLLRRLESLATAKDTAAEFGPQAYHLFISLFVHVNGGDDEDVPLGANTRPCVQFLNMHNKPVTGSMYNIGGVAPSDNRPFGSQNRPPPQSRSGAKMVGQWVKIKQDVAATELRDGRLASYDARIGKYIVVYADGSSHEKSLHSLHEWYMLPPAEEQMPRQPSVAHVHVEPSQLDGMQGLWALALRSGLADISDRAASFLLSLYEKMDRVSIEGRGWTFRAPSVSSRCPAPTFPQPQPEGSFDDAGGESAGNLVANSVSSDLNANPTREEEHHIFEQSTSSQPSSPPTGAAAAKAAVSAAAMVGIGASTGACSPLTLTEQVGEESKADEDDEEIRLRWARLMPGDMLDAQTCWVDETDGTRHHQWVASEVISSQDASGKWYGANDNGAATTPDADSLDIRRVVLRHHPGDEDTDSDDDEEVFLEDAIAGGVCTWPPARRGAAGPRLAELYEWSSLATERKEIVAELPVLDCRAGLLTRVFEQLDQVLARACAADNGAHGGLDVDTERTISRAIAILARFLGLFRNNLRHRTHGGSSRGHWLDIHVKGMGIDETGQDIADLQLHVHSKTSARGLHSKIRATYGSRRQVRLFFDPIASTDGGSGTGLSTLVANSAVSALARRREMLPSEQTLEDLGMADGAQIICKFATSKDAPSQSADFSPADEIAASDRYFDILFRLLKLAPDPSVDTQSRLSPATFAQLWSLLRDIPTNFSEMQTVIGAAHLSQSTLDSALGWDAIFAVSRGHWRITYSMQVLHGLLLPPDDEDVARAVEFRRLFLASGGFTHFVNFVMRLCDDDVAGTEACTMQRQRNIFTLPVCLRSLSFLLAGAMKAHDGCDSSAPTDTDTGDSQTTVPRLHRQFSHSSVGIVMSDIAPVELSRKVIALLRAAHTVHSPLHTSPLQYGPQPGRNVVVEYLKRGGTRYKAVVLRLRPSDCTIDVVYGDDEVEEHVPLQRVRLGTIGPEPVGMSEATQRVIRPSAVFGGQAEAAALAQALIDGMSTLHMMMQTWTENEAVDAVESDADSAANRTSTITCLREAVVPLLVDGSKASGAGIRGLLLASPDDRVRGQAARVVRKIWDKEQSDNTSIWRRTLLLQALEHAIDAMPLNCITCREICDLVASLSTFASVEALPTKAKAFSNLTTAVMRKIRCVLQGLPPDATNADASGPHALQLCMMLPAVHDAGPEIAEARANSESGIAGLTTSEDRWRKQNVLAAAEADGREMVSVALVKLLRSLVMASDTLRLQVLHDIAAPSTLSFASELLQVFLLPIMQSSGHDETTTEPTDSLSMTKLITTSDDVRGAGFKLLVSLLGRGTLGQPASDRSDDCQELHDERDVAHGSDKCDELLGAVQHVQLFLSQTTVPLERIFDSKAKVHKFIPDWAYTPRVSVPNTAITKPRNGTGIVGLVNQGATCYMNSSLQQLFAIAPFRQAILRAHAPPPIPPIPPLQGQEITERTQAAKPPAPPGSHVDEHDEKGAVLHHLQRTFCFLRHGTSGCYDPLPLVPACNVLKLEDPVFSQNDASEFLTKCLDCVEDVMRKGKSADAEVVADTFGGAIRKVKFCHQCKRSFPSSRDPFVVLNVPVMENMKPKTSLQQGLNDLTAPEVMGGDNKVFCDVCQSKQTHTYSSFVEDLPQHLTISLGRFEFDYQTMDRVKLNHRVEFPQELDMAPYTTARLQVNSKDPGDESGTTESKADESDAVSDGDHDGQVIDADTAGEVEKDGSDVIYELNGVLIHEGDARFGHYYSYVRRDPEGHGCSTGGPSAVQCGASDRKQSQQQWLCCNDDRVSIFNLDELEEHCFGGETEVTLSDAKTHQTRTERQEKIANAFVLFYSRKVEDSKQSSAVPEARGAGCESRGVMSPDKEREVMRRPSGRLRAMAAALNQRQLAAGVTKDGEDRKRGSSVTAVPVIAPTAKPSSPAAAIPTVVQRAIARAELFAAVQSDNAKLQRQSRLFEPATAFFVLELCEQALEPRVRSEGSRGNRWTCMFCTLLNAFSATTCAACGGSAPPLPACPLPLTQTATRFFLCVAARLGLQEGARFDVDDPFEMNRWGSALAEHFTRSTDASRWLLRACTVKSSQQSDMAGDDTDTHDDGFGCDGMFSAGNGAAEQKRAWLPAMLFDCAANEHNPAATAALVRCLRVAAQALMAGDAPDDVAIVERFVLGALSLFPLAFRSNGALEAFVMLWAPEKCTDAVRNRLRRRQLKRQHKRRRRRRRRLNRRAASAEEDMLDPGTTSSSSAGSNSDSGSDSDMEVEPVASAPVAGGGLCGALLLRPLLVKCGVLAHLAHLYLGSSSPLAPRTSNASDANNGQGGVGCDDAAVDAHDAIALPSIDPIERVMQSFGGRTSIGSDASSALAAIRIRRATFAPLLGAIRLLLREIVAPNVVLQGEEFSTTPGPCFHWMVSDLSEDEFARDGTGSGTAQKVALMRTRRVLTSPEFWEHIALRHPSQLVGGKDGQEPEPDLPDDIDSDTDASIAQRSYQQFSDGSEFMAWLCWVPCAECAQLAAGAAGYGSLATELRTIQRTVISSLLHALRNPRAKVYGRVATGAQQQARARVLQGLSNESGASKAPLACELSSWRLRDRSLRRAAAHLVLIGTTEPGATELEDAPVPIIFNICNQAIINAQRAGFHKVRDGIGGHSTDVTTNDWLETESDSEDDIGGVSAGHGESAYGTAAVSGPFALRCLHVVALVHRTARLLVGKSDGHSDTKASFELQCSAALQWLGRHPSAWLWALTWLARAASPLSQQSVNSVCTTEGRRCHSRLRRMVSALELEKTLAGRATVAFRPLLLAGRHYEPATGGTSRALLGTDRVVAADIARDYAMVVRGAGPDSCAGGNPNGLYTYAYHYRGLPCYTRLAYRNDGTSRRFLLLCHRDDDIHVASGKDLPPPLAAWYICTMHSTRSTGSGDHTVFKPFYKSCSLPADTQSVLPPSAPWSCEQYGQRPAPTVKKLRHTFFDDGPDGGELQLCTGYSRYLSTGAMEVACVHCGASIPITNQQELEAEWNASQGARSLELQCGQCQGALTVTFRDPPAAFVQSTSLLDDHIGRSYNVDDFTDFDDIE